MKTGDEMWLKITVSEVEAGIVEFYHHDYCLSVSEKDLRTDEEVLKELKEEVTLSLSEIERMADIRDEFSLGDWKKIKKNFEADDPREAFEDLWSDSTSALGLLYEAFTWAASPEGYIYWEEVKNNLD